MRVLLEYSHNARVAWVLWKIVKCTFPLLIFAFDSQGRKADIHASDCVHVLFRRMHLRRALGAARALGARRCSRADAGLSSRGKVRCNWFHDAPLVSKI